MLSCGDIEANPGPPSLPTRSCECAVHCARVHTPYDSCLGGPGGVPGQAEGLAGLTPDEQKALARLRLRLRLLSYGKLTPGYAAYRTAVPVSLRIPGFQAHLVSPRVDRHTSRRDWNYQYSTWRRHLHLWDGHGGGPMDIAGLSGSSRRGSPPLLCCGDVEENPGPKQRCLDLLPSALERILNELPERHRPIVALFSDGPCPPLTYHVPSGSSLSVGWDHERPVFIGGPLAAGKAILHRLRTTGGHVVWALPSWAAENREAKELFKGRLTLPAGSPRYKEPGPSSPQWPTFVYFGMVPAPGSASSAGAPESASGEPDPPAVPECEVGRLPRAVAAAPGPAPGVESPPGGHSATR